MQDVKHPIPAWVTRGKTVRQLIEELQTFENQDMEVRISVDDGDTHACISLVGKHDGTYCLLRNSENYFRGEWQSFMDAPDNEEHGPQA